MNALFQIVARHIPAWAAVGVLLGWSVLLALTSRAWAETADRLPPGWGSTIPGWDTLRWGMSIDQVMAARPLARRIDAGFLGSGGEEVVTWKGQSFQASYDLHCGGIDSDWGLRVVTLRTTERPVSGWSEAMALCQSMHDQIKQDHPLLPPLDRPEPTLRDLFITTNTLLMHPDRSSLGFGCSMSNGDNIFQMVVVFSPTKPWSTGRDDADARVDDCPAD